MDAPYRKDFTSVRQEDVEFNSTRESGFADFSREISRSSDRSASCFMDESGYGGDSGRVLSTAIAGGGNFSRSRHSFDSPQPESVANYKAFLQECWSGLYQLQTYRGILDKSPAATLPTEWNLENYITASVAEHNKIKALNITTIARLLANWAALLNVVSNDIRNQRECIETLCQLRETVTFITLGLFAENYCSTKQAGQVSNRKLFALQKSQLLWTNLLNQQ